MQDYSYFTSLSPLKNLAGKAEQEITCADLLAKFPSYFFLLDEQGQLACRAKERQEIKLTKNSLGSLPTITKGSLLHRLPNVGPLSLGSQNLISYIEKNFSLFAFVSNKIQGYTLSDLIQIQTEAQETQEQIALCFYGDFREHTSFLKEALAAPLASLKTYHFRELLSDCQAWEEGLLARAKELGSFAQEFVHCSLCSAALRWVNGEYARLCENCQNMVFPRQDPSVISLIVWRQELQAGGQELQAEGQEPQAGAQPRATSEWLLLGHNYRFRSHMYSLIAGFVDAGENLEQALRREAWEEAAVQLSGIQYLCSQAWPNAHSLMTGFIARSETPPEKSQPDGKEIESLLWLERSDLRRCLELDEQHNERQDSQAMTFALRDCRLPCWHISASEGREELFFCLPGRGTIARKLIEQWANGNEGVLA